MIKFKIKYTDTMTTYLLNETFKTWKSANDFIYNNLGEASAYEIEEIKNV